MNKNKVRIGSWITLNCPSIAEIMAESDFDWLCIDLEHSPIDYHETQLMIAAIQSKEKKAFVRVGENNSLLIKRVLDAGADGIIVPNIISKADADKAVNAVYYPPFGTRGVGLARAQKYGFGFDQYRDNDIKNIELILQIENINALNELEDIINTDGVDGTFIGPYDLSASIGKPGDFDNKEVVLALNKYEKIAKKYKKLIGYHVVEPDSKIVKEKIKDGYNFIALSFDAFFLGRIIRNKLSEL